VQHSSIKVLNLPKLLFHLPYRGFLLKNIAELNKKIYISSMISKNPSSPLRKKATNKKRYREAKNEMM